MKKTLILSIAALAIVGTLIMGCNKEDFKPLVPDTDDDNVVTLKTTVSLEGGSQTRALNDNGTEAVRTFAVDDQITVIYKNTSNETASAVSAKLTTEDIHNNGKTATFTVTMTNPNPEGKLRYIYPANMAKATISATTDPSDDEKTINYNELGIQDGTLETIGSKYDLAVYDGSLTSSAELPLSVEFENRLALCSFTLKNSDGDVITSTITGMTIYDGTNSYTVSRSDDSDPIYVAMRPTNDINIQIVAFSGSNNYYRLLNVDGRKYEKGNGYRHTLRMEPLSGNIVMGNTIVFDLEKSNFPGLTSLDGITTANIYQSISDTTKHTITIPDGKKVILDGVNIQADNTNAIVCEGDAEIVLSGTNTVQSKSQSGGTLNCAIIRAGTYEPNKSTLTISGEGILNASPYYPPSATSLAHNGAVIGADYEGKCGNIVINSGTITVSNNYGATIGSGRVGATDSKCGTITIKGGTINATSGAGAGIGCGSHNNGSAGSSSCDGINISGGTITARSIDGAAIGSGKEYGGANTANAKSYCGYILITGGTIDAQTTLRGTNDYSGAAIGAGYNSVVGNITISGGNITAIGGSRSAGIGSGGYGSRCGAILVDGGTINATGGKEGAGIGTGNGKAANNRSTCSTITIKNSVNSVIATKGTSASQSIGKGKTGNYVTCGTVTIESGANVTQN